jgi:hypothetical protein
MFDCGASEHGFLAHESEPRLTAMDPLEPGHFGFDDMAATMAARSPFQTAADLQRAPSASADER